METKTASRKQHTDSINFAGQQRQKVSFRLPPHTAALLVPKRIATGQNFELVALAVMTNSGRLVEQPVNQEIPTASNGFLKATIPAFIPHSGHRIIVMPHK